MTVWNRICVPNNILEKISENSVLEDVMTVTADIDVKSKLQLYIIPDAREFISVNGVIDRYRFHISQP
jgi:hypothetical protein